MTLGVSDGNNIYAVRYASDGNAPTLYYSRNADAFYRDHPEMERTFSPSTRFVVSKPGGSIRISGLKCRRIRACTSVAGSLRSCRSSRSRRVLSMTT